MNCERCQTELEDFLYGELGETRAAGVRSHLGECAACGAMRDDLERENEIFAQFYEQAAIEPSGEMWEAIRARISAEPESQSEAATEAGWLERLRAGTFGQRAFGWLLAPAMLRQAAFAILLVALSVAATAIYLKRGGNGATDTADNSPKVAPTPATHQGEAPTPVPSPSSDIADGGRKTINDTPSPKAAPQAINRPAPAPRLSDQELMNQQIARAEREYQKAIRMLDQAIAKRRDGLDPALVKQYESSLALINGSIVESRRAMRQRPDDPTAGQFLLAAYAKKLDLMQDVAMR
ncbi:MAG: anti-sigma factor [Blastocatellales bacterium]